jgi:predicted ABC-type transport system involved in lysophospholipase L1 biosynthesis ATPase subunit
LPQLTALENVLVPTLVAPRADGSRVERAQELLERVGLGGRVGHRPVELSGGERQRVAIARALVNRPGLLLADEPTGNLDGAAAERVADLLFELQRETGTTLVLVTHSQELAARCARRLALRQHRLVEGAS